MRTLYLLIVIYVALIVSGCSSVTKPHPPEEYSPPPRCHHHKDPVNVSFLIREIPNRPYKVLGVAEVSKFNTEGIKRQDATIRDLMREQAASLDGDAIINIKNDGKKITATVIAFKKVLV
jgi:PBP1b-binding outer membrane lipoprotein LpoB